MDSKKSKAKQQRGFRVDPELAKVYDQYAQKENRTFSQVVGIALLDYAKRKLKYKP